MFKVMLPPIEIKHQIKKYIYICIYEGLIKLMDSLFMFHKSQ